MNRGFVGSLAALVGAVGLALAEPPSLPLEDFALAHRYQVATVTPIAASKKIVLHREAPMP